MDGELEQCVCVFVLPALAPCYCFDVLFTDFEVIRRCEMQYI